MKKYRLAGKVLIFDVVLLIFLFFVIAKREKSEWLQTSSNALSDNIMTYQNALLFSDLDKIQLAVSDYYKDIYTVSPRVAYWLVRMVEVKVVADNQDIEGGSEIQIVYLVEPFLGAHSTIGEDQITFSVSYTGEVKLAAYEHLKEYELPEHLKKYRLAD